MIKKLVEAIKKKVKWPQSPAIGHGVDLGPVEQEPGPIHHEEPIPVPTDPTIVDK